MQLGEEKDNNEIEIPAINNNTGDNMKRKVVVVDDNEMLLEAVKDTIDRDNQLIMMGLHVQMKTEE